jgi:hypothetical protein
VGLKATPCRQAINSILKRKNVSAGVIDQLNNQGIQVQSLNVRPFSVDCQECAPERQIILDSGADLLATNQTLWKMVRELQLGDSEVLVDSRVTKNGEDSFAACVSKTLQFTADPPIKVKPLRGA